MILYKKGYLVRVDSWENDGDNPQTNEISALSEEKARQIFELASLFTSDGARGKGIGNMYDPSEKELEKFNNTIGKFLEKHPTYMKFDKDMVSLEDKADYVRDSVYDLGLVGGDFFSRVCERVEVFYFPEDVHCEKMNW